VGAFLDGAIRNQGDRCQDSYNRYDYGEFDQGKAVPFGITTMNMCQKRSEVRLSHDVDNYEA
jgi:hypothetical protein